MPTLIDTRDAAYRAAVARMHEASEALDAAVDNPDADVDALEAEVTEATAEVERTHSALERAQEIERARAAHPVAVATTPAAQPGGQQRTHLSFGEDRELVYREDRQGFFSDVYRAQRFADTDARERLSRHAEQMGHVYRERGIQLRDVGTTAFDGLTIPQYLIDLYAPNAVAGRPYANAVRSLPLPASGMTVEVSRITTATGVAVQATQNSGVQETDIDDTRLTVNVRTYAGQQDVSRQALERSEMVDMVIYGDLVEQYHTVLDSAIINADGTGGTHLGIRSTVGIEAVTFTSGSPTLILAYPKLADAVQRINSNRYLPATAIIMHPRRWGWMTAALDGANRPMVLATTHAPQNAVGVGKAAEYGQVVGTLFGLPVITDANVPTNLGAGTNEDMIFVIRAFDHILWEEGDGMPRRLRFEETNGGALSVKLVVYGYSAFTAGRYPKATATVGGTGLVTPTF